MGTAHYKLTAKTVLRGNWMLAVGASFVVALLGGIVSGYNLNLTLDIDEEVLQYLPDFIISYLRIVAPIALVLGIIQFIVGGMIQLGYCRFLLNLHDGQEASFKDIFSQTHRFTDGYCLMFLKALFVFLWSLLFVIPGIVATYRYAMAPFILAEHPGMRASEAIDASKYMTMGSKMDLFILDLTFIGWGILAGMLWNLGYLALNPYKNASHAAFYRQLLEERCHTRCQ